MHRVIEAALQYMVCRRIRLKSKNPPELLGKDSLQKSCVVGAASFAYLVGYSHLEP